MKYFITGGTGYVGTALSDTLIKNGNEVIAVGRSPLHKLQGQSNFTYISADTTTPGSWQDPIKDTDIIVNLAGVNIFRVWTEKNKKQIYDSRIRTTENIIDAIHENNPPTLLSTSAAGFYGDRYDNELDESEPPGNDFLATVCVDWEQRALKAKEKNARVVLMRFGVVLGKNGGALSKMALPFKFFLGGPLGNGRQFFPWIHLDDLIQAIFHITSHPDIKGPVNFTAPTPVRQKDFAKTLGKVLRRPSFLPAPEIFVKGLMGELGESFLNSQCAKPSKLLANNFEFNFPEIKKALENIFSPHEG